MVHLGFKMPLTTDMFMISSSRHYFVYNTFKCRFFQSLQINGGKWSKIWSKGTVLGQSCYKVAVITCSFFTVNVSSYGCCFLTISRSFIIVHFAHSLIWYDDRYYDTYLLFIILNMPQVIENDEDQNQRYHTCDS